MSELDELITRLRRLVDERHKNAHCAIDVLIRSLSGPMVPDASEPSPQSVEHSDNGHSNNSVATVGRRSNVERVLGCLEVNGSKTVDDITEETGLHPAQVRGVLYSVNESVRCRIVSAKVGTRMGYGLHPVESHRDKTG